MSTTLKLHSLSYTNTKTYFFALLFVIGNILLPQLVHFIPQGGFIFLPIYFFTLIASYKYGIHVGMLTAVLSPVANNMLFGMPPTIVLPAILIKSVILAIAASLIAKKLKRVSLFGIFFAIFIYQLVGTMAEWAISNNLNMAMQDFRLGVPGMLIQLFGGYYLLKAIAKI